MKNVDLEQVKKHLRNDHKFMSGVDRGDRAKDTDEFFTPTELVQRGLDLFSPESWSPEKTFIDHSCGDGQILSEVIIRKMENGSTYERALATTYGIEFMEDNCCLLIKRLYGVGVDKSIEVEVIKDKTNERVPKSYYWPDSLKAVFFYNGIFIKNIVCASSLEYDFSFGENDTELFTVKETFGHGLFQQIY